MKSKTFRAKGQRLRCLAPVVMAACLLGYAATAQALLWQVTFSGYAFLSADDYGFETATYLYNPDDLDYTPPCGPPVTCLPDVGVASGPILSYHYSGLVNGAGGQATLYATDADILGISSFRLGGTTGYFPGLIRSAPLFLHPTPIDVSFDRISSVYPPLAGGGEDGWLWTWDPLPFSLQLVQDVTIPDRFIGRFSISPVSEPATLALLSVGIAGLGFTRRRKLN